MDSIWTKITDLPRFAPLDGELHTDALIIGGGMVGILCAHRLARAGIDYALVEADRIGSGITKNTTAKITRLTTACKSFLRKSRTRKPDPP